MTRRGRKPSGTKLLKKFHATDHAQSRMRAILQTMSGQKTIAEACEELDIGEAMFHRMRDRALAAGLQALEAKPMGRPRTATTAEASRVAELEQQQKDLKMAVHAAELRAEIAGSMPHLLAGRARGEKKRKTARRRKGP